MESVTLPFTTMSGLLAQAPSVYSVSGALHTSIHLTSAAHFIQPNEFLGNGTLELITRSLNGTLPGPTLYLNPGDKLIVDFYNDLAADPSQIHRHNEFSVPNESNLHFHGLHVSGELPSDDVTMAIKPGGYYRYVTTLPKDHLPGTHYLHPHRHGSTALQVGGGAAGVIIIQDTPKIKAQLPVEIAEAPEVFLMLQEIDIKEMGEIAADSNDTLVKADWQGSSGPLIDIFKERFYITNGQVNPTLAIHANEWIRFRVINSGWANNLRINLELAGCEMQLIAKDGVYLTTLPRRILQAPMVNGGRADIMVQCSFVDADQYQLRVTKEAVQPVLTLTRSHATGSSTSMI
jgi:FtsP/CotA-like multicopper oxidase with cupredoxin domain